MTESGQSPVEGVYGVILVTADVERLARFYGDVLGLPLVREEHGGLPLHYGADLGTVHFGIHPPQSFGRETARPGGSVVALQVADLDGAIASLERKGVRPAVTKHDEGFGPVTGFEDPDGNLIELVQLNYEFGSPQGEPRAEQV